MALRILKEEQTCQLFAYFDEFYKAAFFHFTVSAICAAFFALGLEFSRGGSDGNVFDYFIPAMVLSAIHFSLCLTALVLFCVTKRYSLNARASGSVEAHKDFRRTKYVYFMLILVSGLWSVIGASMTGTAGICHGTRARCSYTINIGTNLAIAIVIIVLHVLNLLPTYIIMTTIRKPTRHRVAGLFPTRPRQTTLMTTTPNDQKQPNINDNLNLRRGEKLKNDNERRSEDKPSHRIKTLSFRPDDTLELKHMSRLAHRRDLYYDDSLIGRRVPQRSRAPKDIPSNDVKPLPKKNKKALIMAASNFLVQYKNINIKHEDDSNGTPALNLASSSSNNSFSDEKRMQAGESSTRMRPPSYNDVISSEVGADPYRLPPLPEGSAHNIPDNVYTGNSYPDTELVVVQPSRY